jgi:hypothetical protein
MNYLDFRYSTNWRRPDLSGVPAIENIHQTVYAVASKPGCLNMDTWHSCETTHCRAGWVVHLAGEAGYELERKTDPATAATLIYLKSDPTLAEIPDLTADYEDAMDDMKRLAELERLTPLKRMGA